MKEDRMVETYEEMNRLELMYRYIEENESVYNDYMCWVREDFLNQNSRDYLER